MVKPPHIEGYAIPRIDHVFETTKCFLSSKPDLENSLPPYSDYEHGKNFSTFEAHGGHHKFHCILFGATNWIEGIHGFIDEIILTKMALFMQVSEGIAKKNIAAASMDSFGLLKGAAFHSTERGKWMSVKYVFGVKTSRGFTSRSSHCLLPLRS